MKGASKVIMGATLAMVVSLAIVLGLVLLLLAQLYCSLLLRRRRQPPLTASNSNPTTPGAAAATTTQPQDNPVAPPFTSFYAQGVLRAPRSFLFPTVSCKEENSETKQQQHSKFHQVVGLQESNTSPQQIGIISSPSQAVLQGNSCDVVNHFVYISNPIYDNDARRQSKVDTLFETQDTSPSRSEMGGSSGEDEIAQPSLPVTPPLTPMKKLPAEACSVSLRDARFLGISGTDSNSHNGQTSSFSGSSSASPSW